MTPQIMFTIYLLLFEALDIVMVAGFKLDSIGQAAMLTWALAMTYCYVEERKTK